MSSFLELVFPRGRAGSSSPTSYMAFFPPRALSAAYCAFPGGGDGAGRGEGGEAGGGVEVEVDGVLHGWLGGGVRTGESVFGENGGKWWWLPPTGRPKEKSRHARVRLVSAPTQI